MNTKYPDSITTWIFQAIGLTPDNGVCISDPFNVTAFREFFIQLDLPYQARRLEHIDIKATIFFYGDGGSNAAVCIVTLFLLTLCILGNLHSFLLSAYFLLNFDFHLLK